VLDEESGLPKARLVAKDTKVNEHVTVAASPQVLREDKQNSTSYCRRKDSKINGTVKSTERVWLD